MGGLGPFILAILALIGAVYQIRSDPRIDGRFVRRTLAWVVAYVAYGALGLLVVFELAARADREEAAVAITLFFLGWILIGVVWLIRSVPRLREPPAWLLRPWGALDAALILFCVGAAAYALIV